MLTDPATSHAEGSSEVRVKTIHLPCCFALLMSVLVAFPTPPLQANELHLADVFTNHAVLQCDVPLTIWGTATPDTEVRVQLGDQVRVATAGRTSKWETRFPAQPASATGQTLQISSGSKRIVRTDLLVGEVWYASGQSNMQMTLNACLKKLPALNRVLPDGDVPPLRWLRIDASDSPQPLTQRPDPSAWQSVDDNTRGSKSAVAYFFARALQDRLKVPVGMIEGSWGGKPIEGFIPRSQFRGAEPLPSILRLADTDRLTELATLTGGVVIRDTAGQPGRIYNARVAPIAPYPIRGVLWYQGESNAGRGEDPREYRRKMSALVEGWRDAWQQPALPFCYVQLPAYRNEAIGWVRLREEQRRSLDIAHTAMAVTIDLRDPDIHPANKRDVGKRLALAALETTYGDSEVTGSGPLFRRAIREGTGFRVEFAYASGLMVARKDSVEPPTATPQTPLAHFELADADGQWHPAVATINQDTVLVRSAEVPQPVAVRYACQGAPGNANLYNDAGLPASPFCSDLSLLPWSPPE